MASKLYNILSVRGPGETAEFSMLDPSLWSIISGRESCAKIGENIADNGHTIGARGRGCRVVAGGIAPSRHAATEDPRYSLGNF